MSTDAHADDAGAGWVTAGPMRSRPGESPSEGLDVQRPVFAVPRGAQWGVASLMLAMPLLAAAPAQMLLSRTLWIQGPQGMNMPVLSAAALIAIAFIIGLTGAGVVFGARGWILAVSERQPIALGLAGVMLNTATLLLWLGIGIDLMLFFFQHMH